MDHTKRVPVNLVSFRRELSVRGLSLSCMQPFQFLGGINISCASNGGVIELHPPSEQFSCTVVVNVCLFSFKQPTIAANCSCHVKLLCLFGWATKKLYTFGNQKRFPAITNSRHSVQCYIASSRSLLTRLTVAPGSISNVFAYHFSFIMT